MTKQHFHGSDLEKIEAVYHISKEDIVNFAANVNPIGISYDVRNELPKHIDAITSYPDRDYTALRKSIAEYVHTSPDHILVGNGSTELISLVAQVMHPHNALILGPTYSEYEHEISLCGGTSHYFHLQEEQDFVLDLKALQSSLAGVDLLVICNPNNPTSSQIPRDTMREILEYCKKQNTYVMIDETYVEFAPSANELTSIPLADSYDNLIVLRGVSKFFASPGLRLGYCICSSQALLQQCNEHKNPWTINSLAVEAGEIMLRDTAYIKDTYELIDSERTRICHILDEHADKIKYYPPSANFILLRLINTTVTAQDVFEQAIQKGLMIRDCSTFPYLDDSFLRFCFMKPEDNDRLLEVLFACLQFPV